jgi:hypothetical protein
VTGMVSVPSAAVAAGSLVTGYAVAAATGVRPLGGLVLLAGGVVCWLRWRRQVGPATATALGLAFVAAFAGSHPLAELIGAWPSVLAVAALIAAVAYAVADRRRVALPR